MSNTEKKKCRSCGTMLVLGQSHFCSANNKEISYDDDGDFLVSLAVAAASDSAVLGAMAGGDLAGGIIGDMLDGDLFD